ncbi:hypothetical protein ACFOWU_02660 [Epilithonimonas zeae]|uniref:Uncharacterized protein n=1 Tax=Epilithonimonas zeae TaxID=1416779 RepID=A0A1N6EF70_9FLAO|nr:hypothetical protein [Epilithonimonas zeae]SIN81682.1 hypothetical protein SAMN05444409_0564 [Epilithonimonas zeae]
MNEKISYESKREKKQELERLHRQNLKNRAIVEPHKFSFDDFILLLIITISLFLFDILGSIF